MLKSPQQPCKVGVCYFILLSFCVFTKCIGLPIEHGSLLSQLSSANKIPLGFDMPSGYNVEEMGAESVITKTLGSERKKKNLCITVMLAVLADGMKLLLCVILQYKAMPKKQLPARMAGRCRNEGWLPAD